MVPGDGGGGGACAGFLTAGGLVGTAVDADGAETESPSSGWGPAAWLAGMGMGWGGLRGVLLLESRSAAVGAVGDRVLLGPAWAPWSEKMSGREIRGERGSGCGAMIDAIVAVAGAGAVVVVAGVGAVAVVAAAGGTVGARAGSNEQGNVESKCMK